MVSTPKAPREPQSRLTKQRPPPLNTKLARSNSTTSSRSSICHSPTWGYTGKDKTLQAARAKAEKADEPFDQHFVGHKKGKTEAADKKRDEKIARKEAVKKAKQQKEQEKKQAKEEAKASKEERRRSVVAKERRSSVLMGPLNVFSGSKSRRQSQVQLSVPEELPSEVPPVPRFIIDSPFSNHPTPTTEAPPTPEQVAHASEVVRHAPQAIRAHKMAFPENNAEVPHDEMIEKRIARPFATQSKASPSRIPVPSSRRAVAPPPPQPASERDSGKITYYFPPRGEAVPPKPKRKINDYYFPVKAKSKPQNDSPSSSGDSTPLHSRSASRDIKLPTAIDYQSAGIPVSPAFSNRPYDFSASSDILGEELFTWDQKDDSPRWEVDGPSQLHAAALDPQRPKHEDSALLDMFLTSAPTRPLPPFPDAKPAESNAIEHPEFLPPCSAPPVLRQPQPSYRQTPADDLPDWSDFDWSGPVESDSAVQRQWSDQPQPISQTHSRSVTPEILRRQPQRIHCLSHATLPPSSDSIGPEYRKEPHQNTIRASGTWETMYSSTAPSSAETSSTTQQTTARTSPQLTRPPTSESVADMNAPKRERRLSSLLKPGVKLKEKFAAVKWSRYPEIVE